MDSEVLTQADIEASQVAAAAAASGKQWAASQAGAQADGHEWWRSAVIYQVYVRSFADADGDGTGDLAGVRSRLPYLRDLGVDAIWFNPWYASPLADGGYDVSDYRAIHPMFGTLDEAERLIDEAAEMGIRTIVDIVPNHVSDQHPWFQAALAAGPGSPERERFWFRDGAGENGDEMPTAWVSSFQGDTWSRTDQRGRHARPVVPAPVHGGAAGPQLEPPGRARGARGHPAVLVRPRRGRGAHRLRRDDHQGPRIRPAHGGTRSGPAPAHRPRRDPRRLSRLARRRRRIRPPSRAGWRGVARGRGPLRSLPARRRDAHGLQLRLHDPAVGRANSAREHRAHARRARARRSAPPRGCSPTTTSRARSRATAATTRRSRSIASASAPPPTSSSGRAVPARPPCSPPRCPVASTSTKATSSASQRRSFPPRSSRTRCTSALAAMDPGRDGCRVPLPWTRDGVSLGFGPADGRSAVAPAARTTGRTSPWRPKPRSATSMLSLYRTALAARRASEDLQAGDLRLA